MVETAEQNEVEARGRLLVKLGEPEAWLEAMRKGAGLLAKFELERGDATMSERWSAVETALAKASTLVD